MPCSVHFPLYYIISAVWNHQQVVLKDGFRLQKYVFGSLGEKKHKQVGIKDALKKMRSEDITKPKE